MNVNVLTAKERRSIYVDNKRHYIDSRGAEVLALDHGAVFWPKSWRVHHCTTCLGTRKTFACSTNNECVVSVETLGRNKGKSEKESCRGKE